MFKKKRRGLDEINSSSMADIAFLLLVFFLVTTTISMDKGINIVLPADGEQKEIPKTNITNILINESGKILLDDTPTLIKDIKGIAEKKMAANDKMIFSVQSHSKTKYNHYLKVLDQLKMAKATRISIANPDM
jgi:biopolymer transport protein ExbD